MKSNLTGYFEGKNHCLDIRVYHEDTDFTGIAYHAGYIRFMERGRSDFCRMLGIHHHELSNRPDGESLAFAVRSLSIEYLKPAKIDNVVQVRTRCVEMTGTKLIISQEIHRDSDLLTKGLVSIVLIDGKGKPKRIPEEISKKIHEVM